MKRCFAAVLALVLLLFGCGKEIGETVPNELDKIESCISVLTGERDFGFFLAQAPEPKAAAVAEALVQAVLEQYPAGFPEQWGNVEILLADGLTGADRFAHGDYAGFTQRTGDGWLMVLDVSACDAGTVHHEIAHILDGILTEAGALTEGAWMEFCPDGFVYGGEEDYEGFFADTYATTDLREDRARTFEAAVLGGPGIFEDQPALWLKLEYFSRAIRSYFDTEGWPGKTIWELGLE